MAYTISSTAIAEKNKLSSTGAFLLMLKIAYKSDEPVRVTSNNEITTWNSQTWYPAGFDFGDIGESKDGEVPNTKLVVHDVDRRVTPYLDSYAGGVGANVEIYVVHSNNLESDTPDTVHYMSLKQTQVDYKNSIYIDVGAENLANYRIAQDLYLKNICRFLNTKFWGGFKGVYCKYSDEDTECLGTLAACQAKDNSINYGGFPALGSKGIYK